MLSRQAQAFDVKEALESGTPGRCTDGVYQLCFFHFHGRKFHPFGPFDFPVVP